MAEIPEGWQDVNVTPPTYADIDPDDLVAVMDENGTIKYATPCFEINGDELMGWMIGYHLSDLPDGLNDFGDVVAWKRTGKTLSDMKDEDYLPL